mmetsp:Transcript_96480/g.191141  ORF Transcript_96480/g.191141 Transcript_96480/m.191141 type:complete len:251 (-) Transcript_96480:135-887(-)
MARKRTQLRCRRRLLTNLLDDGEIHGSSLAIPCPLCTHWIWICTVILSRNADGYRPRRSVEGKSVESTDCSLSTVWRGKDHKSAPFLLLSDFVLEKRDLNHRADGGEELEKIIFRLGVRELAHKDLASWSPSRSGYRLLDGRTDRRTDHLNRVSGAYNHIASWSPSRCRSGLSGTCTTTSCSTSHRDVDFSSASWKHILMHHGNCCLSMMRRLICHESSTLGRTIRLFENCNLFNWPNLREDRYQVCLRL